MRLHSVKISGGIENYFIIICIHCNIKPYFCSQRKNRQQGLPHKQKNWGISLPQKKEMVKEICL
nr:MAG TPA: hypothetical protein [Caudoviricetes sp.]